MKRKSEEKPNHPQKRKAHERHEDVNDEWFQLYCSSLRSFENADFDAAIDDSLQALTHLDTFKTMVLDNCASAYAMKGKFSKAMKAAEKMIESTPTKAAGYLRAGYTLALQGKHKQAIKVYEQGVEKVPIDDEQYMSLEDRKAASQAQLDKRVDFFISLPDDIVYIIIDELDITASHIDCMDVSKKWRQLLAEYTVAWREITLEFQEPFNPIFRFIPMIGKHAKRIEILNVEEDTAQQACKALIQGQFSNIQHLDVKTSYIGRDQLLLILSRLGNTLTELILKLYKRKQALPLESILLACPKLESLRYHIDDGLMEFSDANPVASECNVKALDLHSESITAEVLHETIIRCPHLQQLRVYECPAIALNLINDYCPDLNVLGFNGPGRNSTSKCEGSLPGIQELYIHDTNDMGPEHVIPLIENAQSTLEIAVLALSDDRNNIAQRWNDLTKVKAEKLCYLTYCFGVSMDMHTVVAKMMRNSKALRSVTIQDLTNVSDNVLEEALLALPNLEQVTLLDLTDVNVEGFTYFLTAHAHRGKASLLREVYLERCNNVTDAMLESLSKIETLEVVKIQKCSGPTAGGLVTFIKQVRVINTLRNIHLDNMDIVTDTVLYYLADVASLRSITLFLLANITADAVRDIIGVMANLEDLSIVACSKIGLLTSYSIMAELNEKKKARAAL